MSLTVKKNNQRSLNYTFAPSFNEGKCVIQLLSFGLGKKILINKRHSLLNYPPGSSVLRKFYTSPKSHQNPP